MAATWRQRLRHLRLLWRLPHQVEETTRAAAAETKGRHAELERGLALNAERLDASHQLLAGHVQQAAAAAAARATEILSALGDHAQRLSMLEQVLLGVQRQRLRERFGPIRMATEHPVATASPDHLNPGGTARDNSRNQRFNARLTALLDGELSVLDLGCSGGGAVRSFIEQGCLAVGVEGSDYSANRLRAEWLTIPEFLFTADITQPFRLHGAGAATLRFRVVTLWEVMEHIAEADLPAVFANIDAHLAPGGLVILSVSPNADIVDGVTLHQTVRPRPWWEAFFTSIGWTDHPGIIGCFGEDLVRGGTDAPNSFHCALSRAGEMPALASRFRRLTDP